VLFHLKQEGDYDRREPHRTRLLFVDDEESIRLTLPPLLEREGFDVTAVGSVADALVQVNCVNYVAKASTT